MSGAVAAAEEPKKRGTEKTAKPALPASTRSWLSLMGSYCRARLVPGLTPRGGIFQTSLRRGWSSSPATPTAIQAHGRFAA